jgi:hypothetical protein
MAYPTALVTLAEVKQFLSIRTSDRDAELEMMLEAARPEIESLTGPIVPQIYDESYAGGNHIISLSHRPSVGYGTSPVLNVLSATEYVGSTAYSLVDVADASLGTIYSFEVNVRLGIITRRSAGGGTVAFPAGPDSVHIVYQAGQASVPANVRLACLEAVRVNYETTQAVGAGRFAPADALDVGVTLMSALPPSARRMLGPTRRGPSIA